MSYKRTPLKLQLVINFFIALSTYIHDNFLIRLNNACFVIVSTKIAQNWSAFIS